jgi:hypothetical protein
VFPHKKKERIKMQRNSKAKNVILAEAPLQQAVAIVNSNTSAAPREKRKEDASKPLYLKRV